MQLFLVFGLAFAAWSRFAPSKVPIAWQENPAIAQREARGSDKLLFVYFHMPT